MTPDTGILTQLLNDFRNIFTLGLSNIQTDANYVLGSLIVIDLVLALLLKNSDSDTLKLLVEKTLKYGFFIYLVLNYRSLVTIVLKSFAMIGLKAGGNSITQAMLSDPSALSEYGIFVSQPIFNHIANYTGMDAIYNIGDILISFVMGLLIIASFAMVGIQVFITYLEFYIVGCLALILIPWGANQHTSFLGEKAIGAVFSFGIKLMVLSFIASAAVPLVSKWVLPEDPTFQMMIYTLLGSAAIAFLSWHAPQVAAGLLAGSPSFGAATAAGSFLAAVSAVGAAKTAMGTAAGGAMRSMGSVAQAAQIGATAKGGFKGAMAGISRSAMANSAFGQGRQDTHYAMRVHASAMRAAGMKDRLAS